MVELQGLRKFKWLYSFSKIVINSRVKYWQTVSFIYPWVKFKRKSTKIIKLYVLMVPRTSFWVNSLDGCLNVKELLARSRREIWSLNDCNWTWTHKHVVHKQALNHLLKLSCVNGWVFVYELSGCGCKSSSSHLKLLKL